MPAIHSINLEFVVSTRHSKYIFNKKNLEHDLILVPHYKTHSVSVYLDNNRIGYVSRKDTPFVFDCLKYLKSKPYLITDWNIVCHKPYYIVISCNIKANLTWKVWIYQLMFKNDSYVGSTICLPSRINAHKKQLKQACHHNKKMVEAYKNCNNKIYNIQILESTVVSSNHEKLKLEQQWIDKMKPSLNLCNAHSKKAKVKCECGSVIRNKKRHNTTNKHILYVCQSLMKGMIDNICANIDKRLPENPQNMSEMIQHYHLQTHNISHYK